MLKQANLKKVRKIPGTMRKANTETDNQHRSILLV
jgi:hypothetical protein